MKSNSRRRIEETNKHKYNWTQKLLLLLNYYLLQFVNAVAATEATDHSVENELMTAIWSHGQKPGDERGLADFYRDDEVKYHSRNRGVFAINFHGQTLNKCAKLLISGRCVTYAICACGSGDISFLSQSSISFLAPHASSVPSHFLHRYRHLLSTYQNPILFTDVYLINFFSRPISTGVCRLNFCHTRPI